MSVCPELGQDERGAVKPGLQLAQQLLWDLNPNPWELLVALCDRGLSCPAATKLNQLLP